MSKPAIAAHLPASLASCSAVARSARPGLSSSIQTGSMPGLGPNIEGFTVAGKGYRRGQARPRGDRPGRHRLIGADRRCDRQVPRRQEADPRRIRRAEARQRHRRGARAAGRPEGQMQSPYFFGYQPNTRNKTEVQLTRKLVVKAADIRKMDEESVLQLVGRLLDVAQDAGAKVGPQNNMNYYYYYRWGMNNHGRPGAVRPRGLRQAPGRSLREGDRRCAGPGRAAGAVEPGRARADRGDPGDRGARRAERERPMTRSRGSGWRRRSFRRSRFGWSCWCGSRFIPRPEGKGRTGKP